MFDKNPGKKHEIDTMFFSEQNNTSSVYMFEKEVKNEIPDKFSEHLEQGCSVHGVHKCARLTNCQFMRNDLGTSES
jgi:hypothetical protein